MPCVLSPMYIKGAGKNNLNESEIIEILLYPENANKVCFLCFKQNTELSDVYTNFTDVFSKSDEVTICCKVSILEMLNEVFALPFSEDNNFTKICSSCLQLILISYKTMKSHKYNMQLVDKCAKFLVKEMDEKCPYVSNFQLANLFLNLPKTLFSSKTLQMKVPKLNSKFLYVGQDENFKNIADAKLACHICSLTFNSSTTLNDHEVQHHNKKSYECVKCHMIFNTKALLRIHNTNAHKKSHRSNVCDICGKICKSTSLLRAHSNSHKCKECPYCKKLLKTHAHFKIHIKRHITGVNVPSKHRTKYNCHKCKYSCLNKETLEGHDNKVHLNVRPFVCELCFKGFYRKSNLVEHALTHGKEKTETSEICGDGFANKRCLREHLRLHSGEKPYPCDLCEERFVSSGRRLEHKKRKHFEKDYNCDLCDKKYSLRSELYRHQRKVHNCIDDVLKQC